MMCVCVCCSFLARLAILCFGMMCVLVAFSRSFSYSMFRHARVIVDQQHIHNSKSRYNNVRRNMWSLLDRRKKLEHSGDRGQ